MNTLEIWAAEWGLPEVALHDLRHRLTVAITPPGQHAQSEGAVQQQVRLEAAEKRILLFRNNVGVLMNAESEPPRPVRFGLANDSKALNERIKSGDLVGLRPGGQFVSREIKHAGWKYTGTDREVAQLRWIELVQSHGGDAAFATGRGTL
jgi:hypothetical protein